MKRQAKHHRTYRILPIAAEYRQFAPAYGPLPPAAVARLRRVALGAYMERNRENAALVILPSRHR